MSTTTPTRDPKEPLDLDFDGPVRARDPREDEDWFLRLPEDEQDRLRERWQWEADRFQDWDERQDVDRRRMVHTAAAIFAIAQSLQTGFAIGPLVVGLLIGAGLGFFWAKTDAGRFVMGGSMAAAFFITQAVHGVIGVSGMDIGSVYTLIRLLCGGLLAVTLSMVLGVSREFRRLESVQ